MSHKMTHKKTLCNDCLVLPLLSTDIVSTILFLKWVINNLIYMKRQSFFFYFIILFSLKIVFIRFLQFLFIDAFF
jgi:hypothetical protein